MTNTTAANPLQKYFRQPKIYLSLPSKGEYYPEGSIDLVENNEYPVFAMTAKDEMIIKTPDALLNGQATVDIIQSCIPNIKNAWNMPSLDVDAALVAIRIASYGEMMTLSTTTPVTQQEKDYELDLKVILERLINASYNDTCQVGDLTIKIRPLNYKEFTSVNLKTFEEQRIFAVVNDEGLTEEQKLAQFQTSFKKLTELTVDTLKYSIESIQLGEEVVTQQEYIGEFIDNADRETFEAIKSHLEKQKDSFEIKPMIVDATPEEISQGVPESYEIPIAFDQTNFFV
ncbi:MAG: hypothetical protein VW551_00205 [Euryarchaeota archaeon]|jgi:hypothetical protein